MIVRKKLKGPHLEPFVKVVVDIERNILAYGCELHIDCADELVHDGSNRNDLWGANVYPQKRDIHFVSLINIRPVDGNRSMEVELPDIKEKIRAVITDCFFSA